MYSDSAMLMTALRMAMEKGLMRDEGYKKYYRTFIEVWVKFGVKFG